jgi:hypothetical protein
LRVLVLALDRDRSLIDRPHHEHVDLAILRDDRLAEVDLAIHDQALLAVLMVDVRRDQIAKPVTGVRRSRVDRLGAALHASEQPELR